MTIDDTKRRFRDAMACLPAAVNIITTDGPSGRCGITASAVCSVTDEPPTFFRKMSTTWPTWALGGLKANASS